MSASIRKFAAAVLFALLVMAVPAVGDDDGEHGHEYEGKRSRERHEDLEHRDALRGAVERGEAKPLAEVLRIVAANHPGDIVGVEVELKGGVWIYEVRVADSNGRLIEVHVDAASGVIAGFEEK
ncbi:MAG: PepSY domain-containing protein [Hyphomicrobium sp.]